MKFGVTKAVCSFMICGFLVSGCSLTNTHIKRTTIDEQISRNQVRLSTNPAEPAEPAKPAGPAEGEPAGKPEDRLYANEAPPETNWTDGAPAGKGPDRGDSWEHLAPPGILGLQTKVRRFTPDPEPKTSYHLDLAFDNADLTEILDLLLFEHFNIKYMIDPSINAKLTFHVNGEFTNTNIVDKLNSILSSSDIAIVEGVGSILRVVRKADAARAMSFLLNDPKGQEEVGDVTRLIKLKYLNAPDLAKTLRFFLSKNAQIVPDQVHNSILVTDTPENILKAASIVDSMDAPFFSDVSWKIFPVFRAKAENIATEITKVFKTNGLFTRPGMSNGSYYITPITTINGILVVTRWPELMDTVASWIKIMDQADEESSDVFVYYVENGTAAELADILVQVYGGQSSTDETSGSQKIVQATDNKKQAAGQKTGPAAKTPSKAKIAGDLIDDVKIIADETNNAIVFKANPRDYVTIRKVLKKLDIMPRQVLLNVVVAEVTLSNSFELGVQWMLSAGAGDYKGVAISGSEGDTMDTSTGIGTLTGLNVGVFNAENVLKTLIRAVGTDSKVNILSSPNIIGLDNQEAQIEVTTDVPVESGSAVQSDGTTTKTYEYKQTGIILTVTPSINSRGLVKLELTQEVSEVGNEDYAGTGNSSFFTRKATTSVVAENNQTIFIGGMMREKTEVGDSGVPFLKDIPGLGYLFKKEQQNGEKLELIFLITPHVIRSRTEADEITREFTRKISQIKGIIAE